VESVVSLASQQSVAYFSTDPAEYDFSETRAIATLEDTNKSEDSSSHVSDRLPDTESQQEKKVTSEESSLKQPTSEVMEARLEIDEEQRLRSLKRVFMRAFIYSSILTLIVVIIGVWPTEPDYCRATNAELVPLPMYFSHYVFSRKFYTFWVACSM
jgi:hypothetical protein